MCNHCIPSNIHIFPSVFGWYAPLWIPLKTVSAEKETADERGLSTQCQWNEKDREKDTWEPDEQMNVDDISSIWKDITSSRWSVRDLFYIFLYLIISDYRCVLNLGKYGSGMALVPRREDIAESQPQPWKMRCIEENLGFNDQQEMFYSKIQQIMGCQLDIFYLIPWFFWLKKAGYVERDGDLFWATLRLENENWRPSDQQVDWWWELASNKDKYCHPSHPSHSRAQL